MTGVVESSGSAEVGSGVDGILDSGDDGTDTDEGTASSDDKSWTVNSFKQMIHVTSPVYTFSHVNQEGEWSMMSY